MKKIIYTAILSIAIVSFSSCSKDENIDSSNITEEKNKSQSLKSSPEVASFEEYFEFMNSETNAKAIVESFKTSLSSEGYSATASIVGETNPITLNFPSNLIDFTDFEYSDDVDQTFANKTLGNSSAIYGNHYDVTLTPDELVANPAGGPGSSNHIYVPQLLDVTFSGLSNGKVVAGSQVNWNVDADNTNGVVIGIEYNPNAQPNEDVYNAQTKRFLRGATLSDTDGSYTFTSEDFEEFPDDAIVTFYAGRAGFSIIVDNNLDFSLSCLTAFRTDLNIQQ